MTDLFFLVGSSGNPSAFKLFPWVFGKETINERTSRYKMFNKFKENVMLYENKQNIPQDKRNRYSA